MANVSNSTGVFIGINELHVVAGGFASGFTLASGATLVEVPVAEDSGFSYTGGTPSVERYRIHGLSTPWAAKMTPGDAETNLFIPQVTKELLTLFGFTAADLTIAKNSLGTTGALAGKFVGTKFKETSKEVDLGIVAINRTEDGIFGIKKSRFLASLVFDDANSAKPVGIQLTGASVSGGDADAMFIGELDASSNS